MLAKNRRGLLTPKEVRYRLELSSEEANGGKGLVPTTMQHQKVIQQFINRGAGRGTYVKTDGRVLTSEFPHNYRPWGHWWHHLDGHSFPLAVRLDDGNILVNGARLDWPAADHQTEVIQALQNSPHKFGVVPYHSLTAAWTDGEVRDWNQQPIPLQELQREVGIVVPSVGERWRVVTETDKHGRAHTRKIHVLGDSVVRLGNRFYLSMVDPTGTGNGMFCFTELLTGRAPASLADAFNALKPELVREAEARGATVHRQGEWFAVPVRFRTSELMGDVDRGVAVYRRHHVLGRDGHHQLDESVLYRSGPRKGEVFARGMLTHVNGEHRDLDLGTIRWHQVVRSIQRAAYTLSGSGAVANFD